LSTCPAFGVEQLELLKPSASNKCTRCDRPDDVNNYNKLARNLLFTDKRVSKKSNYFDLRKATHDKETPKRFMGKTIPATLFYQTVTSSSKIVKRGHQNGELCLLQMVSRRRTEKLTQTNRRRLRQREVVIWRLLRKKANIDYKDYSREW